MIDSPNRRRRPLLLIVVLCAALAQLAIGAWFDRAGQRESPYGADAGFPLDDAWIHLVYARSIAERGLPEYNPGTLEAGQSSLLWGVLLAPVVAVADGVGIVLPQAVRLFGILVWIACAAGAALVVLRLPVPAAPFGACCAAALIALDPGAAFCAGSGMEPLLAAATALFSIAALQRGRFLLAGLLAGLCVLARPEGVVLAAFVVLAAAMRGRDGIESWPARAARVIRTAAPIAVLTGVWIALCLAATGRPLPNTFYAKAHVLPLIDAAPAGLAALGHAIARSSCFDTYVGYLFLAMGALGIALRAGPRIALVLLGTPVVFCVGIAATRDLPDQDAFFWARYLEPIRPFILLITAIGMAAAGGVIRDVFARRAARAMGVEDVLPSASPLPDPVLAVVLLACLLLTLGTAQQRLQESATRFAANVHDTDSLNVWTARWLADEKRIPASAVIATQDAGAVRFFQPRPVLDLLGLNDHELITRGLEHGDVGEYLAERDPRVFCLLDPDPGAAEFVLLAVRQGLHPTETGARVHHYSLFGPPARKAFVVYSELPP